MGNLKHILLLTLLWCFAWSLSGQTKTTQIRTDADVMLRLFHNERVPGMVWIGMQIGADVAYIKSNGDYIDLVATQVLINGTPIETYFPDNNLMNMEMMVDQHEIPVPFPLTNTTLVFCNGNKLDPDQWTGIGTQTLSLQISILLYDKISILN